MDVDPARSRNLSELYPKFSDWTRSAKFMLPDRKSVDSMGDGWMTRRST